MNSLKSQPRLIFHLGIFSLTLVIGMLLTSATYHPVEESSTTSFSPLDHLLKDIQDQQGIRLQLVENIDPQGIGVKHPVSAQNPQYLVLNADMTFSMWDRSQRNEGRWNANGHQETMTFYCSRVNGRSLNENPAVFTFQVKAYSSGELVLIGVGRQGRVEMVYAPVPRYEQQAIQLSFNQ